MVRQRFSVSCLALGLLLAGVAGGMSPLSAQSVLDWGFSLDNGDVNGDHERDLSDVIYLFGHLFLGGPEPVPLAYCGGVPSAVSNGDANGDGERDVSDGIRMLDWLFSGGPEPDAPCGLADGAIAGNVPRIAPPGSRAFGKSLAGWLEAYWSWFMAGADPAAATSGGVRLLPIPDAEFVGGSFTPEDPGILRGHIEVTLAPGTPFVLPQVAWIRETYLPELGIPDDPAFPDDVFLAGVTPLCVVDGTTIVSDANEADFYVPPVDFDPVIFYAEPTDYGSIGAVGFQSIGFVSPPLAAGVHEITLDESLIFADPPPGIAPIGIVFDNSWTVIVTND